MSATSTLRSTWKYAIQHISVSYIDATRDDIRRLLNKRLIDIQILDQQVTESMLAKGIYFRLPHIPMPRETDLVQKQSFLADLFGDKRPLSVLEIRQLFIHAQQNAIGKALLIGFSQVAQSDEIREFFLSGKDLCKKYYKQFADVLIDQDISVPPTFDAEVMDSTIAPFTDRLMLNHIYYLGAYGTYLYGRGIAGSQRSDLTVMFTRIIAQSGAFADEAAGLLIKNKWMEQPPLAPDRRTLASIKRE